MIGSGPDTLRPGRREDDAKNWSNGALPRTLKPLDSGISHS